MNVLLRPMRAKLRFTAGRCGAASGGEVEDERTFSSVKDCGNGAQ